METYVQQKNFLVNIRLSNTCPFDSMSKIMSNGISQSQSFWNYIEQKQDKIKMPGNVCFSTTLFTFVINSLTN